MKQFLVFAALLFVVCGAYADFDLGDLPPCDYPTLYGNPAHSMSGIAWLGACVTQEANPWPVNADPCDDGVLYIGLPWTPCTPVQVQVTVTAGPNYASNALWLNGWKDGDMNGNFCDTLCNGLANEWIVQDVPVVPGVYTFTFIDPGVTDMGVYPGVFRWRLTGRTIGRMGFGMYAPFDCPTMPICGNFGADSLGEVEDYWIPDAQLAVEFGQLEATAGDAQVRLNWTTRSEVSNDHFDVMRDGNLVWSERSQGNTATGNSYTWTDEGVANGTVYTYQLYAVSVANERELVATSSATPSSAIASEYALHQNYPNPFNPETQIAYDLVESGHVSLKVYNMVGQEVATLVNGTMSSGQHVVKFNASSLPSGIYVYRLNVNGYTDLKKMLLIK